jgi:hypothetical protein
MSVGRCGYVERRLENDSPDETRYSSLAEFYPHYLAQHANPLNRSLHIAGTGGVLMLALGAAATRNPRLLLGIPVAGYGLAWAGHFLFERNRPATFRQPLYSLASDFLMFRDALLGRLPPPSEES